MLRFYKFFFLLTLVVVSCSRGNVSVEGVVEGVSSSDIVVRVQDINKYTVIDTLKTDEAGHFDLTFNLEEGQPDFVYLYHHDNKVASLLLSAGDDVHVVADTLGNFTVTGSDEAEKFAEVEKRYALIDRKLKSLVQKIENSEDSDSLDLWNQEVTKEYISYYRESVKFLMKNSSSLSVVPLLYQNIGGNLMVFAQTTDAIHYRNVCDSLLKYYPESKYVAALQKETEKRFGYLQMAAKLSSADSIGFPEIELSTLSGEKVKLSDVDAEVILVHFWTASDANHKMYNIDGLLSLYKKYKSKGFEIYQVAFDSDKSMWARVMKAQDLPWINVCDSRGMASPYINTFNIPSIPASFLIHNGEIVEANVTNEQELKKVLDRLVR